jgi:hypothetical protein
VEEDADLEVVLLELEDGLGCALVRTGFEVVGGGARASRQAAVRREGSSSEKM